MRGEALPPLCAARSPLGSGKLTRGGSRDCGNDATAASAASLLTDSSDALHTVNRSGLSGNTKTLLPPDRSFVNDFEWTKNSRDLPANVRPIIEDNKMLQEELRRYRLRLGEQEGTIAMQNRTITGLRDELQRQRVRLRDCSAISPAQLMQEQQFRQALKERDEAIFQERHKAEVLERAKAAAERRAANDMAAERRAAAALKQQLRTLQDEMAEKAKQHRFNQLLIKDLYQRLEPVEAAVAAAAQAAQQAPPSLPPPTDPSPPPEPQVVCQLMLCMVYEQLQPTAAEIAEAAARLAVQEAEQRAAEQLGRQAAATQLQAAVRGLLARRRLAVQHAAATTIQAAARGFLVRQALATVWEAQEAAEEAAQAAAEAASMSPAQPLAQRQREAELHFQRRAVAGKAKPQKRLPARQGSTARGANTAVEAAARRRGMLPAGGAEGRHVADSAVRRQASALTLQGSSGGGSVGPSRQLSSLAGLSSGSPGRDSGGLLAGAGAVGPSRGDAGGQQGHAADRGSLPGTFSHDADAILSAAQGSGTGSPTGSPVHHQGGRLSMARMPQLQLNQRDVQGQRPGQRQLAQSAGSSKLSDR